MNIEIIAVCEAATMSLGKLSVIGVCETIYTPIIPVTHRGLSLLLRLRFSHIEQGDHLIRLQIVNADGKLVAPVVNRELIIRFTGDELSQVHSVGIPLDDLTFTDYGEHLIDVAIDGRHTWSLPLYVKQMIPAAA